jgi:hypothetical protein
VLGGVERAAFQSPVIMAARGKIDWILVARVLGAPLSNLLPRQFVFPTPDDAVTDRLWGMKRPSSPIDFTSVIEQPDVCQDCAPDGYKIDALFRHWQRAVQRLRCG